MKEVVLSCLQNGEEYEFCGSKIRSGRWFLDTYLYLERLFGDLGACAIIVDKNSPDNEFKTDFDLYIFPDVDRVMFCDDGKEMWPSCSMERYVLVSSRKLDEPHVERYPQDDLEDEDGAFDTSAEFDSAFSITGYYKGLVLSTVPEKSYYNGFRAGADYYHLAFKYLEMAAFDKLTTLFAKMK